MFSNAWWHWLKENWWKLLLKAMLLYFVFLAIYFAVVPLLNFQPWFSWWKTYGGNKLKTPNCFSMTSLAYARSSKLYYYISSLFQGEQKGLNLPSILFLGQLMTKFAKGMASNGYLTPKSLCESIVPDENIYPFQSGEFGEIIQNCIGNIKDGSNTPISQGSTWPTGSDLVAWQRIIEFWGGASMCPEGDAQPTEGPCKEVKDSGKAECGTWTDTWSANQHGNLEQWISTGSKYLDSNNQPTSNPNEALLPGGHHKPNPNYAGNFLWEIYGMPFDSLAIRAFLSKQAGDWKGLDMYPVLLESALGGKMDFIEAGGWFGVVQETGYG